jgi:hypothetical protein
MKRVIDTKRGVRVVPSLRPLALAALLILPLVGCNNGDECDTCSSDDDCQSGLVCSTFSDGSQRCGSGVGASSCRVR